MVPFGASPNSASTTASTPLFASPSHGGYNPNRSYYFGSDQGSSHINFKQRRRNLRGRNGLFKSSSGSPLALVPTLLRAVLLSPLLVLVLYLTFRTSTTSSSRGGGSHGNAYQSPHQRNSPALAKTYYDHNSRQAAALLTSSSSSSSSSSTGQQVRADCMTGETVFEHGALKRDLCNQQAQTLSQQQQLLQSSSAASSTSTAASGANYTEGDATVLLLPPPPLASESLPMTSTSGYGQSSPMGSAASLLDSTTSTIVRPRPQPKRMVANYYNPMMESTLAQQAQLEEAIPMQQLPQRVIVQPSHLKVGEVQPMQLVTSTAGGSGGSGTSTLLLVQQEVEAPSQQLSEELLVPPNLPQSTSKTVEGVDPPLVLNAPPATQLDMPVPAAQMSLRRRRQQQGGQQRQPNRGQVDSEGRPAAVAYYYYDPRRVHTDARTGQLVLPEIVYDASGAPHRLSHLRAKQVWMEADTVRAAAEPQPLAGATSSMSPPKGMASTSAGAVSANLMGSAGTGGVTATTAMMVGSSSGTGTGSSSLSSSSSSSGLLPQWGESTATDQSIIICTVGLMALLVGAVSARKFRKQSILSACIENEALDHEHSDGGGNEHNMNHHLYGAAGGSSSYKTFEGWRGDLEKFDV